MGEKVISIKDLSKSFGNHEVLRKIDIDIEAGEIICIVGMYRRTSMNTAPGWEWYFSPLTYLTI